ncbi:Cdc37 N terminal kinase binding-domain-containing protein [Terfezia claveryi]|nr:Cdc37 N terminal kinase binding-domain-containing protein [Terfezia claveryi]
MVDYSKWDRLELSDDSDIEVHPNVDKRSFIRAKQRMIHEERQKRKAQIEDLKAQRIINDELLKRITTLIEALEKKSGNVGSAEEQVFKTMMEITVNSQANDKAPALSHYQNPKSKDSQPTYTQMMASLVDQVKKEVDGSNEEDRWKAFLAFFQSHHAKLMKLQADATAEQAKLEKEEASKITSESIHDGFNSSFVNKPASAADKKKPTSKVAAVEQINPNAKTQRELTGDLVSSGAEADVEEVADESEADGNIKPTAIGYEFAKIKVGDYRKCLEFITQNPNVVAEKEENGLLIEAFNSQIAGKDEYAQQCVHQALLLQYCRQLGRDGVGLFFKRYV